MNTHHQIVIVGGGNAGLSVAAQLLGKNPKLDIAIVEPSEKHYYQPGWTLVGGGVFTIGQTIRDEAGLVPEKVKWIKDGAETFDPENNTVVTKSGGQLTYDFLVVCCGIQINWGLIRGLPETLGKNGVCSNYHYTTAPYTYECIKGFMGGRAVFTQPASTIKCGAAPQKIMYLAADNFRRRGLLEKSEIYFYTGKEALLRVKEIHEMLTSIARRYGINVVFKSALVEVRGEAREAVFEVVKASGKETVTVKFDMLHVTPLQSAPDFIKQSPLAVKDDPQGWVDIEKTTFQHNKYPNVFSLGDVSNAGDVKTGAAVRVQAPILVRNLLAAMEDKPLDAPKYDGYTACPITTGYGKLLLAEFDYNNRLTPTLPFDTKKERYSIWLVMKHLMPWFYWNRILRGKA